MKVRITEDNMGEAFYPGREYEIKEIDGNDNTFRVRDTRTHEFHWTKVEFCFPVDDGGDGWLTL